MCEAINGECAICDGCQDEIIDWYDCVVKSEFGCTGLSCPDPTPRPTASPTTSPTENTADREFQCKNDRKWFFQKPNGRKERCGWVKQNPEKRCNKKGRDDRKAFEACPKACGNSKAWKAKYERRNGKPSNCNWVKNKPGERCGLRDADGTPAFKTCAVACCKYNKKRYERKKERQQNGLVGGEEDYDEDEYEDYYYYDEEDEDYEDESSNIFE